MSKPGEAKVIRRKRPFFEDSNIKVTVLLRQGKIIEFELTDKPTQKVITVQVVKNQIMKAWLKFEKEADRIAAKYIKPTRKNIGKTSSKRRTS